MCGSMVDIQFAAAEIRRGKKKKIEDRRKKPQGKNIMSTSAMQGGHNYRLQLRSETKNTVLFYSSISVYLFPS